MARAPGSGPHVFVDDLDRPVLTDDDDHHLRRVLRTRPGDPLTVSDGRGRWRPARMGAGPEPEPHGDVAEEPLLRPALVVGLVPVKGQRPEWAVQKLTELGVDGVWLLRSERSVVRWEGERAEGHRARLERVAREAAMQSRRSRLPEVRVGLAAAEALATPGAALAHPGGAPPTLARPVVLVGPEGGWAPAELEAAAVAGVPTVGMGPTVLRAETAAVAAGVLLTGLRAGVVTPRAETGTGTTVGG